MNNVGVVIIGRNEGIRLQNCIKSVLSVTSKIVYVDSGSTDGSTDFCIRKNVKVFSLDMDSPFSAARARNEGFQQAIELYPSIEYIQFIDGDCVINGEWLKVGLSFLENNLSYAIVAGQRKEIKPKDSIYNLLCDIEWNTPIGDTTAIGGDFLIRTCAFSDVDGFNPIVVAGEEPDLCYRLNKHGWMIYRYDHEMTLHDANMTSFHQWWNRAKRTGHAYTQGYFLHRKDNSKYYAAQLRKLIIWGFVFPLSIIILGICIHPVIFLFLFMYFMRMIRIILIKHGVLLSLRKSLIYSWFTAIAAFPQFLGFIHFIMKKISNSQVTIIEHK